MEEDKISWVLVDEVLDYDDPESIRERAEERADERAARKQFTENMNKGY